MLSEIFMQIYLILTKLRQLKLGGPAIMPHRVVIKDCARSIVLLKLTTDSRATSLRQLSFLYSSTGNLQTGESCLTPTL